MGQFVGCIEGMRAACLALDYPVVSGNVSLYNETNGTGILPDPGDRRRRPPRRGGEQRRPCLQTGGPGDRADRRDQGSSRGPRSICARSSNARRARRPARRSRRRAPQRRLRARPDPGRTGRAPATTSAMAGCSSPLPRWRWPAASAPKSPRYRPRCRCTASSSARDQASYVLTTAAPDALPRRRGRRWRAGDTARRHRRRRVDSPWRRCHIHG